MNALAIVKKCVKDRHLNTLLPSPRCLSFTLLAYFCRWGGGFGACVRVDGVMSISELSIKRSSEVLKLRR